MDKACGCWAPEPKPGMATTNDVRHCKMHDAAREMLAALKQARSVLERLGAAGMTEGDGVVAWKAIRAVIDKAEGRTK